MQKGVVAICVGVLVLCVHNITHMATLNSLLNVWNLEGDDQCLTDVHIRGHQWETSGTFIDQQTATAMTCSQCNATNTPSSNWCVECGKCMIAYAQRADSVEEILIASDKSYSHVKCEELTLNLTPSNKVAENTCSAACVTPSAMHLQMPVSFTNQSSRIHNQDVYSNRCRQEICYSAREILDSTASKSDKTCLSQPTPSLQLDETLTTRGSIIGRKWQTSGIYMWRKKNSIKRPQDCSTPVSQSLSSTSSVPTQSKDNVTMFDKSSPEKSCSLIEKEFAGKWSEQSSLLFLPNELLLIILAHLPSSDLRVCKTVCKSFYCLISDFLLGTEIVLTGMIYRDTLKQCCKMHPSSLTLKKCQFHTQLAHKDIQLSIRELGSYLKRLILDACDMRVSGCGSILQAVGAYCPNVVYVKLEWINVTGTVFLYLIKNLSKLEELHLVNVSGISIKDWNNVLIHLSHMSHCKLHTLQLKLKPELPVSSIINKHSRITSLKIISFRQNMREVSERGIEALLLGAPNIKTVEIECIEISQNALKNLSKREINIIT